MKKQNITLSLALAAVFSSSVVLAEAEITGKIVHESAVFTQAGIGIGAASHWIQTGDSHGKDIMKTETSARIFIDGDAEKLYEGATYHVEVNLMHDSKGVDKYDGNESYTQRDALREAYVDAEVNDYSLRAGKQQVVWGTADGMKLLDAINPTDYSEMAQNQMEDSRIPVWMINAEVASPTGSGDVQMIISEPKSHKIAGLGAASGKAQAHTNGNAGNAFIMKGVDSITGKTNGFLNVAAALGGTALFFQQAAGGGTALYTSYNGATVEEFVANAADGGDFSTLAECDGNGASANCLYDLANDTGTSMTGAGALEKGGNLNVTNLLDTSDGTDGNWDISKPNSAFEYMAKTSFATFYSFADMTTEYRVDHPEFSDANVGLRFKDTTPSGVNYSVNYLNHYDSNPYINMHWEGNNKQKLTPTYETVSTGNCGTQTCTTETETVVTLFDGASQYDIADGATNLVFTEKLNRINSLGGSFDTAVESAQFGPVVIRGEFLYDRDVKVPEVNLAALSLGDITGGVKSVNADFAKYVLGADITVMTNMMVSGQFIQLVNLDYVDTTATAGHVTGARYTADPATMHLTNQLNKGEEFKNFYSLFLSKPFGASGEHRWNNIFMFEEGDGMWNRLDAEFSVDDNTQVTLEWNEYFGDENTQFGQLNKSSNIQAGFKYSF
jgi:hypothetical protein